MVNVIVILAWNISYNLVLFKQDELGNVADYSHLNTNDFSRRKDLLILLLSSALVIQNHFIVIA